MILADTPPGHTSARALLRHEIGTLPRVSRRRRTVPWNDPAGGWLGGGRKKLVPTGQ